jgi:hypothetical protein
MLLTLPPLKDCLEEEEYERAALEEKLECIEE